MVGLTSFDITPVRSGEAGNGMSSETFNSWKRNSSTVLGIGRAGARVRGPNDREAVGWTT